MNSPTLILTDPPQLTDQSASDVLDFLYLVIEVFENQYSQQLRQYYHSSEPFLNELIDDKAGK